MMSDQELQRIYWHSRRGMLELDLVLMPFAQETLATLEVADQRRYVELLAQEDTDIFRWLLRAEKPEDADLRRIVELVLDAHAAR